MTENNTLDRIYVHVGQVDSAPFVRGDFALREAEDKTAYTRAVVTKEEAQGALEYIEQLISEWHGAPVKVWDKSEEMAIQDIIHKVLEAASK